MNDTKISWTSKTWNPVTGCTKYSAGCANCYAEVITRRFKKYFPNGFNVTLHPERLDRQGSLAIFRTVMDYHNPTYNVDKAVDIWNKGASHSYRNNVKKYFRQALEDDSLRAYFD